MPETKMRDLARAESRSAADRESAAFWRGVWEGWGASVYAVPEARSEADVASLVRDRLKHIHTVAGVRRKRRLSYGNGGLLAVGVGKVRSEILRTARKQGILSFTTTKEAGESLTGKADRRRVTLVKINERGI